MHWKTERRLKDSAAAALIVTPVVFLARQASRSDGALKRAGRNAAIVASATGSVAGAFEFLERKDDAHLRDEALEGTSAFLVLFGAAGGVAGGIATLVYDAIRVKR